MTETISADATENIASGTPKKVNISKQMAEVTNSQKTKTLNLFGNKSSESLQIQRKQTSIQRARENRNGGKRSQRELLERAFDVIEDGESRSVSQIAREVGAAWSTTYWLMDLIEFIQSKPRVVREGNMRRKRFYRLAGPRKR